MLNENMYLLTVTK